MPNGGSDCCGTCWFNKKNKGEAGYGHSRDPGADYCIIRDLDVADPFYTYCANHPHRNPGKIEVPIGPVFTGNSEGERQIWVESPDSEEIRHELLGLLKGIGEEPMSEYPIGPHLDEIVVAQIGEFRDSRAVDELKRIASLDPNVADKFGITRESLVATAKRALRKIQSKG